MSTTGFDAKDAFLKLDGDEQKVCGAYFDALVEHRRLERHVAQKERELEAARCDLENAKIELANQEGAFRTKFPPRGP